MNYSEVLKFKPYDFQEEGIKFMLDTPYSILGDTMGLGKTLQALAVSFIDSEKTLIIVPAYLQQNWVDEIEKFSKVPKKVLMVRKVIGEKEVRDHDIFIVSYASFMKCGRVFDKFDCIVADECHYFKSAKANRTKNFVLFVAKYRPKRVHLLSGTPVINGVPEFWSLLKIVWFGGKLKRFDEFASSIYKFSSKFCDREHVWANKYKFVGIRNRKLLVSILGEVYLRRRSSQVLDLPAMINKTIKLSKKCKFDKELMDAWKNFLKKEGGEDLPYVTIKTRSALYKIEATIKQVRSILDNGFQCVVYSDHVESATAISDALKGSKLITGKTPIDTRAKYVKGFNNKKFDVLVGTIRSMSTGINLTSASHMVFNDLPWTPALLLQARKRIHRIGQDQSCFYYYIISSDTDHDIYEKIMDKVKMLKEVMNV